jgi:hypothetical protein
LRELCCPSDKKSKDLLLIEMIARTIKKRMNHMIREQTKRNRDIDNNDNETSCKQIIVDQLNLLFGESIKSIGIWNEIKKEMLDYFGDASLDSLENTQNFIIKDLCSHDILFKRIFEMIGIKLTENAQKDFERFLKSNNIAQFCLISKLIFILYLFFIPIFYLIYYLLYLLFLFFIFYVLLFFTIFIFY